jgi:hypothetical protein
VARGHSRIGLVILSAAAGVIAGCGDRDSAGGGPTPSETRTAGALTATAATGPAARAAYWAAEATRYRDIANHERQISAAYAAWTPPAAAAVTKNWNATLKPIADARAVAADQIAVNLQAIADFETAAAAKAGAQ